MIKYMLKILHQMLHYFESVFDYFVDNIGYMVNDGVLQD